MEVAGTQLLGSGQAKACPTHGALDLGGACFKHGDVIVCATTARLRARLGTAPIRSRGVGGNGRTGIVLRYGYLKLER